VDMSVARSESRMDNSASLIGFGSICCSLQCIADESISSARLFAGGAAGQVRGQRVHAGGHPECAGHLHVVPESGYFGKQRPRSPILRGGIADSPILTLALRACVKKRIMIMLTITMIILTIIIVMKKYRWSNSDECNYA
jgi:hypothetical protein